MTEQETKNEIFIHLLRNSVNVPFMSVVEDAKRAYYELHDNQPELEDLRINPDERPPVTIDEAVEKLAFDLKNRKEFREGYKTNIALVILRFIDIEGRSKQVVNYEREWAKKVADAIIDEFIINVMSTMVKPDEEKCCREG